MASETVFSGLEEPTADQRTLALLAHLLMGFSGFIGPLVIFCVKQDSRFVKFHSLQALVWQAIYMVLIFVGMAMFFVVMFSSLAHNPSVPRNQGPPPAFVFLFPLLWLGFMGGWLLNLILGVVYGIRANRGEWATYPIFGKWLLPQTIPSAK